MPRHWLYVQENEPLTESGSWPALAEAPAPPKQAVPEVVPVEQWEPQDEPQAPLEPRALE